MKYFAILKDSLREALDSKVLYVLIALSTLAIFFVASLSFHPLSAERTMAYFFSPVAFEPPVILKQLNSRHPEKWMTTNAFWVRYSLEKVELLRGAPDSPDSDYTLTIACPSPAARDAAADQKNADEIRRLFADAEDLGFIKVGEIEPVAEGKIDARRCLYRVALLGTPATYRIWATAPNLFFGAFELSFFANPLAFLAYQLASYAIGFGSWLAVILGVIITSFFIPNMLRKGTVDLLLVKPINRSVLLLYKYFGGLTFIFVTTAYAIGGIWLALGLRSGLWAHGALLLILTLTFFFAVLYSVSALIGVLTRSVVTSIMLTMAAWLVFFLIGTTHAGFEFVGRLEKAQDAAGQAKPPEKRWGDGWTAAAVHAIHAVTPRTADLNQLNDLIVFTDFTTGELADMRRFDNSNRNWIESLLVSSVWIGIFLGLAMVWFSYKDY